jgi:hypothetical protein
VIVSSLLIPLTGVGAMSVQDDSAAIADGIRSLRVLTGAIVAGAVVFLLIVVAVTWDVGPKRAEEESPSMQIYLGVAIMNALLGLFLPLKQLPTRRLWLVNSLRTEQGSGEPSTSDLINLLKGFKIMRLALLEGACFMTLICTIITGNWWLLLMAGALLALMLWQWPTVPSVARWVLEQRELIRQES